MSTVTETPAAAGTAGDRLRHAMAGVRLSISWLGVRKSLTPDQKSQAAQPFGAEGNYVSAAKKLLDTSHPAYKSVTTVKHRIVSLFKGMSLPYPEPGIRLIRQEDIELFDHQMQGLREELAQAVQELDRHYVELREAAEARLGSLYNPSDYPPTLLNEFSVEWDFPSFEPPEYLRQLNPQLYQQECQRIQSRFDEAVQLAEQAFTEELAKLVDHLVERLSGQADGKPKIFRDTAVENLTEFFDRFRHLNIGSDAELETLVERAQQVVRGVEPQQLRDSSQLRQQVATQLSSVQSVLDGLLVDRPRRNILRRAK